MITFVINRHTEQWWLVCGVAVTACLRLRRWNENCSFT